MKSLPISLRPLLAILTFLIFLLGSWGAMAAAPNDENYNDDGGYTNSSSVFTIDGIKYTLTSGAPDTVVTNQGAGSGGSPLGDDRGGPV